MSRADSGSSEVLLVNKIQIQFEEIKKGFSKCAYHPQKNSVGVLKQSTCIHLAPIPLESDVGPDAWNRLVKKLPKCRRTELFDEEYLDTKDGELAKKGWWYTRRDGQDILKKTKHNKDGFELTKSYVTDRNKINKIVQEIIGDKSLIETAAFTTRRYFFSEGDACVIDMASLPNGKRYVLLRLTQSIIGDSNFKFPSKETNGFVAVNSKMKEVINCKLGETSEHFDKPPQSLADIWDEAAKERSKIAASLPECKMDPESPPSSFNLANIEELSHKHSDKWLLRLPGREDQFFDTYDGARGEADKIAVHGHPLIVRLVKQHERIDELCLVAKCYQSLQYGHITASIQLKAVDQDQPQSKIDMVVDTGCAPALLLTFDCARKLLGNILTGTSYSELNSVHGTQTSIHLKVMSVSIISADDDGETKSTAWVNLVGVQAVERLPGGNAAILGLPFIQKFTFSMPKSGRPVFIQHD